MRLVERSRGVRPAAQPRIASVYAPEPIPATDPDAAAISFTPGSSSPRTAVRRNEDVSASVTASGNAIREAQAGAYPTRHERVPEPTIATRPPTASLPTANEQQSVESKTALTSRAELVTTAMPIAERRAADFSLSSEVPPHSTASPTLASIHPRSRVSPQPPEPSIPEQRSSPVTSTIRVTIGRVEVRAVTPAQSAPRPARRPPPGPPLSLDDYLKQRGGRQR